MNPNMASVILVSLELVPVLTELKCLEETANCGSGNPS